MKILVADDHDIIRRALKMIIEKAISAAVVEEVSEGNSVIKNVKHNKYDLLILDINMPGPDSFTLIKKMLKIKPHVRILIFSMNPDIPYAKLYLQQGVMGYLNKTSSETEITEAIHTVLAGKKYVREKVKAELIKDTMEGKRSNPFNRLSPNELKVLRDILKGEEIREIRRKYNLQPSTVSTYKTRIYEKLGTNKLLDILTLAKAHHVI